MNRNFFNSYILKEQKKEALKLLSNTNLAEGKLLNKFEKMINQQLNTNYTTVVNSGSIAIYIALLALNLKPKDEIIMTNRSWISTFHAAKLLNLKVKFIDVNLEDENINPDLIENTITKNTKVLLTVNRNGKINNRTKINKIKNKYNLYLIEDCAQSFLSGQRNQYLNKYADFTCFSFSSTKLLNIGKGGAVVSKNKKIFNKIKNIKYNGVYNTTKGNWKSLGFNFKFTDIQSAFGIVQLRDIETKKNKLIKLYNIFNQNIYNSEYIKILKVKNNEIPLYIEILCPKREKLLKHLSDNNIGSYPFYNSLTDSPLAKNNKYIQKENYSAIFKKRGLWLLSGSSQKKSEILRMCKIINEFQI
jgi:perosamine synthetase